MRVKRNDSGDEDCRQEIIDGAKKYGKVPLKKFNGKDCVVLKKIGGEYFLVTYLKLNNDTEHIKKVDVDGCFFQVGKERMYDIYFEAFLEKL